MQPLTPYELFSSSVQPRYATSAPATDIATSVNTALLALICLPLICLSSVLANTVYQQLRARLLKQQRAELARVRYESYRAE